MLHYFHTLRHLRPIQIWYRAFYFFRKKWRRLTGFRYQLERSPVVIQSLDFHDFISSSVSWQPTENRFRFLHAEQVFPEKTDWNCAAHGKLWQYNLHYFDCLHQSGLDPTDGLRLMQDFVKNLPSTPEALEPYPTALRIVNWVKFLSKSEVAPLLSDSSFLIHHSSLDSSLLAQAHILADNLEYHLLGNHLLEDGFGLLFAASRYRDERLMHLAEKILKAELDEQFLPDGGHFERSPMYQQILLHRVLDAYNLLKNNSLAADSTIFEKLSDLIPPMLAWSQAMTHPNGQVARFHDATDGIAPSVADLSDYARRLGFEAHAPFRGLTSSGYFRPQTEHYTLIADAGDISPDYQPGHAHSQMLSFELSVGERPLLVNTGISTYEKNKRRCHERSTTAHNTLQIKHLEQSDTWSGHRVGRRARAVVMEHTEKILTATHTGYDRLGVRHVRYFECGEAVVQVVDEVRRNSVPGYKCRAYFHFHPDVTVLLKNDHLVCGFATLIFKGFSKISLEAYEYAEGFNLRRASSRAVVEFAEKLETQLIIHNP